MWQLNCGCSCCCSLSSITKLPSSGRSQLELQKTMQNLLHSISTTLIYGCREHDTGPIGGYQPSTARHCWMNGNQSTTLTDEDVHIGTWSGLGNQNEDGSVCGVIAKSIQRFLLSSVWYFDSKEWIKNGVLLMLFGVFFPLVSCCVQEIALIRLFVPIYRANWSKNQVQQPTVWWPCRSWIK